eukprot:g44752.t1
MFLRVIISCGIGSDARLCGDVQKLLARIVAGWLARKRPEAGARRSRKATPCWAVRLQHCAKFLDEHKKKEVLHPIIWVFSAENVERQSCPDCEDERTKTPRLKKLGVVVCAVAMTFLVVPATVPASAAKDASVPALTEVRPLTKRQRSNNASREKRKKLRKLEKARQVAQQVAGGL